MEAFGLRIINDNICKAIKMRWCYYKITMLFFYIFYICIDISNKIKYYMYKEINKPFEFIFIPNP